MIFKNLGSRGDFGENLMFEISLLERELHSLHRDRIFLASRKQEVEYAKKIWIENMVFLKLIELLLLILMITSMFLGNRSASCDFHFNKVFIKKNNNHLAFLKLKKKKN